MLLKNVIAYLPYKINVHDLKQWLTVVLQEDSTISTIKEKKSNNRVVWSLEHQTFPRTVNEAETPPVQWL